MRQTDTHPDRHPDRHTHTHYIKNSLAFQSCSREYQTHSVRVADYLPFWGTSYRDRTEQSWCTLRVPERPMNPTESCGPFLCSKPFPAAPSVSTMTSQFRVISVKTLWHLWPHLLNLGRFKSNVPFNGFFSPLLEVALRRGLFIINLSVCV